MINFTRHNYDVIMTLKFSNLSTNVLFRNTFQPIVSSDVFFMFVTECKFHKIPRQILAFLENILLLILRIQNKC